MTRTTIPTACKVDSTASRGCVSSQATSSARLQPGGHFRIVASILDLHMHTDGNRAAGDLTWRGDRVTCDVRLESLVVVTTQPCLCLQNDIEAEGLDDCLLDRGAFELLTRSAQIGMHGADR